MEMNFIRYMYTEAFFPPSRPDLYFSVTHLRYLFVVINLVTTSTVGVLYIPRNGICIEGNDIVTSES